MRITSLLYLSCKTIFTLLNQLYDAAFVCWGVSYLKEEKEMKMNTKLRFTAYGLCL